MKTVRTRIAPSPTGENLHIGNAYTAYINYIFARKNKGSFIIRVEDTDRSRLVAGSQERILQSLRWLGIDYDEGPDIGGPFAPYSQSERLPLYRKYAEELVAGGHAYYCFCTKERLDQMRKDQEARHEPPMYDGLCKSLPQSVIQDKLHSGAPHVIRLNVPDSGETVFHDIIRGEIRFENQLIDDQVILKSDGFPTYHLGVVVDDHIMEISHIIRGEEWISSTPKHILLYNFFGWEVPQIAHLSVLRNPDRSKLSKRKNPVWVSWYREQGILPEALKNYFATLAWSHPEGKDIFTEAEMMRVFDLDQIQTTAPIFDFNKLRWTNGEYLRAKSVSQLVELVGGFFPEYKDKSTLLTQIMPLVRERMKTLAEFKNLADFFFNKPVGYEQPPEAAHPRVLQAALAACAWTHDDMEQAIRMEAEKHKIKPKELFMSLRLLITGKTVGPPLLESMEILGKTESLARIVPV